MTSSSFRNETVGDLFGNVEVIGSIVTNGSLLGAGDAQQYLQAGEVEAMRFLIVIEKAARGFSAYSPDLPGCVAAAATRRGVEKAMREAIEFHLDGLRQEGDRVPSPRSYSTYVEVPA